MTNTNIIYIDWLNNSHTVNIIGEVSHNELPFLPTDREPIFILESSYLKNQVEGCWNISPDNKTLRYYGIFKTWGGSLERDTRIPDFITQNRFLKIVNK